MLILFQNLLMLSLSTPFSKAQHPDVALPFFYHHIADSTLICGFYCPFPSHLSKTFWFQDFVVKLIGLIMMKLVNVIRLDVNKKPMLNQIPLVIYLILTDMLEFCLDFKVVEVWSLLWTTSCSCSTLYISISLVTFS